MIKYIHKSDVSKLRSCSQAFYYERVIGAKPEFESERGLAGIAFHAFAKEIYTSTLPDKWNNPAYWCEWFINKLNNLKENCVRNEIDINSPEDLKAEEYLEMIVEFLKQPYNREATAVLLETPFRFCLTEGKGKKRKEYWYEGTIDQLLKIPTKALHNIIIDFNSARDMDRFRSQPYLYIHRDVKTGERKIMSELNILTNEDLMFYSYGLAYGVFNTKNNWATAQPISKGGPFIPFAHALYYTRDHLKYIRGSRDGTKPAGSYKGQAMYLLQRDINDLAKMRQQLIDWHKKANNGIYTRDAAGGGLCERWCQHKVKCLHELRG